MATIASLIDIKKYFNMSMQEMKDEFSPLSDEDKQYFKEAVGEAMDNHWGC